MHNIRAKDRVVGQDERQEACRVDNGLKHVLFTGMLGLGSRARVMLDLQRFLGVARPHVLLDIQGLNIAAISTSRATATTAVGRRTPQHGALDDAFEIEIATSTAGLAGSLGLARQLDLLWVRQHALDFPGATSLADQACILAARTAIVALASHGAGLDIERRLAIRRYLAPDSEVDRGGVGLSGGEVRAVCTFSVLRERRTRQVGGNLRIRAASKHCTLNTT